MTLIESLIKIGNTTLLFAMIKDAEFFLQRYYILHTVKTGANRLISVQIIL